MQLVLGSVIFTESGYAENDWMLGVCSMRKKLPYRIQTFIKPERGVLDPELVFC